ncbi:hypothetical protein RTS15_004026 [Salmonella enterica]|nr:hypothetical protein [Salmonella enterica]
MKNSKSVNELISAVNEFLRNSNQERLIDNGIHKALCNLVDAVSQQQEIIDSQLEQIKANSPSITLKMENPALYFTAAITAMVSTREMFISELKRLKG